jgi:hypothetical protein
LAGALSSRRALLHHVLDSRDSYKQVARVLVEALVSSVSTAGPRDDDFGFFIFIDYLVLVSTQPSLGFDRSMNPTGSLAIG